MTPAALAAGGRQTRWSREAVIEKIQEWVALYGEPPRSADWNHSSAKWSGQTWRIARYEAGDWPSLNAAKRPFGGSLNAAVIAAGFTPSKPGPKRANAAPVLSDRSQMAPDVRDAVDAVRAEVRDLEHRLAVRERQLERALTTNTHIREERDAARTQAAAARRPRHEPARTRTVVRTDKRAVGRLEVKVAKLTAQVKETEAAAGTLRREAGARVKELERALADSQASSSSAAQSLQEVRDDLRQAVRDRKAAEDRLAALKAVVEKEIEKADAQSANDEEVQRAQRAEHEAEIRAARAEREMREQASAITGENRKLTAGELKELRKGGPSGPGVLASAFKELAHARAQKPAAMYVALTKVASAAIRWRDTIR